MDNWRTDNHTYCEDHLSLRCSAGVFFYKNHEKFSLTALSMLLNHLVHTNGTVKIKAKREGEEFWGFLFWGCLLVFFNL